MDQSMRTPLAESENFVVTHEYELAFVTERRTGRELDLGSHYGDPICAVIAPDESWFAVGGEGITGLHQRLGEFSFFRDRQIVGDVRVRYEDPASGAERVLDGIQSNSGAPVYVKKLTARDGGKLEAVLDDGEDTTVVLNVD